MRLRMQTLTSDIRPSYSVCTSCHAGAVKGWCVLLHLPFAKRSFSESARVNNGNSVIQWKCGVRVGVYVPVWRVSCGRAAVDHCRPTAGLGQLSQTKSLSTKCRRPSLRYGGEMDQSEMNQQNPSPVVPRAACQSRRHHLVAISISHQGDL